MGRVFNPGFLNSCTLRVSVLLEMGPPEIWDAEQEAITSGFRKEVVGDFFFFSQIWASFSASSYLLTRLLCPAVPGANREGEAGNKTWGMEGNKGKMK